MKADLSELLKAPTLKSEIYKTISGSKFGSIGHLLKNSVKKGVKYVEFASEGTEAASDIIKPTMKSNRSVKKLNSSANDSSLSNKKMSKEASKEKLGHVQRTERRLKAASEIEFKQKSHNYMLMNSQKSSKEKNIKVKPHTQATFPSGINKNQSKQKKSQQKNTLSKSKSKLSCKMNLSSIIEQSSSQEQLITPQHKKNTKIRQNEHLQDKTTKKQRKQPISEEIRKKVSKSFTDPAKFIKLIKNQEVTISYRVLKRKLIEIQIYVLKNIQSLSINLEKGNLECQNIQQTYKNLAPQTLLALFSSVRDINILDPYNYPQLHIEMNYGEETMKRYLTLPYTFLNFADEKQSINTKKSRIKTKLCLERLPINPKKLKILSSVFKTWSKKHFKGQSEFETHFNVNDHEFRLRLVEEKETFTMQLQGRGEEKLTKVIDFFSKLIC